jgi:hypothetical protein
MHADPRKKERARKERERARKERERARKQREHREKERERDREKGATPPKERWGRRATP